MYQDLSFMNVPLPEDILKLKIYLNTHNQQVTI